ncbi:MAG: TraB/GumN family protein, partial [Bacteroidota bacterium]
MRTFLLALLVSLFAVGCSPKASVATAPEREAPPRPALVGPPPAPASAAPAEPVEVPKTSLQDTKKYAPTSQDTSLLWQITAPGVATPSYLFGTIHIIPEKDYFLPNRVVAAINKSKEVVFEIDPREMQNPAMLMSLMSKINMRGDTSLEDLLSEEQYTEVEEHFSASGMPFFLFKRMKPMFLSAMVGQDMESLGGLAGGESAEGGMKSYELELTEIAEAGKKT